MRTSANNRFSNLVFYFMVFLLFTNVVAAKEQSYFAPSVIDLSDNQKVAELVNEHFNIQLIYCDQENQENSFVVIGTANIKNGELNYFKNYKIYDQLMDYFKVIEIAPTYVKLAYHIEKRMVTYKLSVLNGANSTNANNTISSNSKYFAFNETPIYKMFSFVSNVTNNKYYFDKEIDVEKKLSFFLAAENLNELISRLIKQLERSDFFTFKVEPKFYMVSNKRDANLSKPSQLDVTFCKAYLGSKAEYQDSKFWFRGANISAVINPELI